MKKVISVRFKENGKSYYFDPGDAVIHTGEYVIVETARGVECGEVVQGVRELADAAVPKALKPITRMADSVDVRRMRQNREDEKRAFHTCQECIARHGLEMKLVEAEYTLDRSKIMFYFTADGRVDFRELVKDLAGIFHTRIELRQIGVRDESKMIGGLGICGQPADGRQGAALANAALGGALAKKIRAQKEALTAIQAHLAAWVDFPEEDVPELDDANLHSVLGGVKAELDALIHNYQADTVLREGVDCAIVGRPNAGKSTLLNLLAGFDRADRKSVV